MATIKMNTNTNTNTNTITINPYSVEESMRILHAAACDKREEVLEEFRNNFLQEFLGMVKGAGANLTGREVQWRIFLEDQEMYASPSPSTVLAGIEVIDGLLKCRFTLTSIKIKVEGLDTCRILWQEVREVIQEALKEVGVDGEWHDF